MKGRWKKSWTWGALGGAVYLALLVLLVRAERGAPGATITSLGEALWFSLVTLTTAGYGDCFPVTPWGRVIGVVFLLFSAGFLAFCIGLVLSAVAGKLLPRLRLALSGKSRWYLFPAGCREAAVLAAALLKEEPDAGAVFWREDPALRPEWTGLLAGVDWYWGDRPWQSFLRRRPNSTVLILGPEEQKNYALALEAAALDVPVYCQSSLAPKDPPNNLTFFDRRACCARLYWQREPVRPGERELLVLGAGEYAAALVEQGLLEQVSLPGEAVTWHLFGDWSGFAGDHPRLRAAVNIGGSLPGEDTLVFHPEPWNRDPDLLERAGRILICGDRDEENLEVFRRLTRWFPVPGQIHLRLARPLPGLGAAVFGGDEELFTPEQILRRGLDRAAMEMHRCYRRSAGDGAPRWEELSPFLQRSNRAAADHLPAKLRLLLGEELSGPVTRADCRRAFCRWQENRGAQRELYRELEHRRWLRFYALHNWQYGDRDDALRRHPALLPFGELSPAEQAKDDYAWELLGDLGREGKEEP